ncbi:MAG TPA: TatD family hydrolase [Phycisphaerales bacterium]|nr:TatD family hydrolase [Phycisphaerales bacterium]
MRLLLFAVIDTHCHLTFPDFAGSVDRTLAQAAAAGVSGCITISTTTADCLEALEIAKGHERVWCTAGVHPLHSDLGDERAARRAGPVHVWENLRVVASHAKCVGWGELGLDNHYPKPAREVQRAVLDEQLAFIESVNHGSAGGIGKAAGLPVVVHCREAFDDLLPVLRRTSLPAERFVFHCFTGGPEDMRKLLDFGAWASFTGVLTYPNAPEVREAARMVPAERIMVETDAPFLSPIPHRGKRPCLPAYTADTARFLAEVRGVAWEEFHEQLNVNTRRFFNIDAR